MSKSLNIIIVEKVGILKLLSVKDFKENELYKKCGFKKEEGFVKQVEWKVNLNKIRYYVYVYAKTDGRANSENKYDFPPPIDTKLFYGNCAIIIKTKNENGTLNYTDLSVSLWDKIYEKLFGGFEDLDATAKDDEEEEDELENIPKEQKTKHGYLKDGFVVDSSETGDDDDATEDYEESYSDTKLVMDFNSSSDAELSEESYDYNKK